MAVGPADDSWLTPGMMLLDKYRVESILGKGGMGIVVRAFHPGLHEHFAIKILRDDIADPEAAARFLREAQATAKLKNAHIARVHDVGTTDEGMSYMVMELLLGGDIGQLLEGSTFAPADAVDLVLQACEALAEAHAMGIVHRDIKPQNLFVVQHDERPYVKVLDFGISKVAAGMEGAALTQTQSMLGTPAYMSPEQMRSARTVDLRSDLWSLGTVLYEMIEGELPFSAENFSEMVVKVSVDPPTPPRAMSPGLAAVVLRCLEKPADLRYASMLELAQALAPHAGDAAGAKSAIDRIARYVGGVTGPVRPVTPLPVSAAESSHVDAAAYAEAPPVAALALDTVSRPRTRRRWGMIAATVLVTALAVVIGVTAVGGQAEDPPAVVAPAVQPAPKLPPVPADPPTPPPPTPPAPPIAPPIAQVPQQPNPPPTTPVDNATKKPSPINHTTRKTGGDQAGALKGAASDSVYTLAHGRPAPTPTPPPVPPVVAPPPAAVPPPPAVAPCSPFDHPKGC